MVAQPFNVCYIIIYYICYDYRRKFRSQTSDNMDRWKSRGAKNQRKGKKEDQRRERVGRKKMQVREKVGKSRNTVFFQWFVPPEGPKVGSLKRRVRSQLARWEMKNCTPLWREAHFQVRSVKNWRVQSTFGRWDVEKVHAIVARSTFLSQNVQSTTASEHFWKLRCWKSARCCGAKHISKSNVQNTLLEVEMSKKCVARSTFRSQNVQNTSASEHFWKLRCRKSARRCGAKHMSKSKCTQHTSSGPLLEVEMLKKCTPLWREAHFEVKSAESWGARSTVGRLDVVLRGRRKGLCTLPKVIKTCGFCSISKNDGRRGTLEEDLQRCIFCGRRSTRDMFIRDVRRWGHWFSERGWVLEHQIWQALYFRQVEWKNCKTHWYEAVSSALKFPFLKEVSQNCFVFDVVKFRTWGSLAELLRFGCCQVQALRKSRRIASFWTLSS